jgi:HD-GYP domain-containing protein (c-di-GMP phosphodiesterase class II)
VEQLASLIAAAVNVRTLYPQNHPRVLNTVDQMIDATRRLHAQSAEDSITYLVVGDDLVAGDQVLRRTNLSVGEFIELMKQRGIERLTLAAGVGPDEVHTFVSALASGESVQSSAHIIVGRAQLAMEEGPEQSREHREVSVEQLELMRDAWARFRVDRRLPIDHLEELVWSLIESVGHTTRSMLPLSVLKAHDEYTFVHSVNVSLLVLAQARSFGIWGRTLHAFGMAGLLHDIGKLTVPLEVLNKPGALEKEEWEVMKGHAQEGAWHLSEIHGTEPLTVIVAFEHHLRYDGRPNYPLLRAPRMPAVASRMTAIADTYDAMLTVRPYQQSLGRAAAFELLKRRSGTFYDPTLVANFIRLIEDPAIRPL